jgi:anti-sigma regulatory factor (Ser/Thr protein kinase)
MSLKNILREEVLSRQSGGDVYDTLAYSLREVIRNVVEHSESNTVQFCAQHWPTMNRVHLAILDRGRGVRASLSRNPYLTISSDVDALKLSLMPGVSGRMHRGIRRQRGAWQNTGYGLYMTSRLAVAGGNFWVVSGDHAYGIASGRVREVSLPSFQGTALRISLDTSQLSHLQTKLRQFADEGAEIARSFQGADPRGASTASTMIRTRF